MPRWHYARVHKRSFRDARLPAPPLATIPAHLAADAPCGLPPDPLLVLHAEDDPVVPASVLASLALEDGQCARMLHAGAHLGFGTLAGTGIYLVPFDEDAD
jgi:acetyl esterase/lipase